MPNYTFSYVYEGEVEGCGDFAIVGYFMTGGFRLQLWGQHHPLYPATSWPITSPLSTPDTDFSPGACPSEDITFSDITFPSELRLIWNDEFGWQRMFCTLEAGSTWRITEVSYA
jgi:hypothetical protein